MPTDLQEQIGMKKSACSVRNDSPQDSVPRANTALRKNRGHFGQDDRFK
jgi:hypothetical protein